MYELFLTTAPQTAFTCADVLGLYLHRGSFETVLADEDREQDERLVGVLTGRMVRNSGKS